MAPTLKSLGLDALSKDDRLDLIDQLWESLEEGEPEFEVPDWHVRVIDRRIAEAEANPDAVIPWSEFKVRMEAEM